MQTSSTLPSPHVDAQRADQGNTPAREVPWFKKVVRFRAASASPRPYAKSPLPSRTSMETPRSSRSSLESNTSDSEVERDRGRQVESNHSPSHTPEMPSPVNTANFTIPHPLPPQASDRSRNQAEVNGDISLQQQNRHEPSHRPRGPWYKSGTRSRFRWYRSPSKPQDPVGVRSSSVESRHAPSLLDRAGTPNSYLMTWQQDEGSVKLDDHVEVFVTDAFPRQMYLLFLFRLPALYFLRVTRIFEEADLTLTEIKEMALHVNAEDSYLAIASLYPAYQRLITAWELFINKLVKEWETLNVVSVLLLPAIVTLFQIQGAAEDPITRYLAFWSLICALMSLLYGCLFIIYFPTMRKARKAVKWAIEAIGTPMILWNVWVMLAMPAVWMCWSIVTFVVCILCFMWRTSARLPPDHEFSVAPSTEFGFRIFICVVFGIGVTYGLLTIITLKRYGIRGDKRADKAWERRVQSFIGQPGLPSPIYPPFQPLYVPSIPPVLEPHSRRSSRSYQTHSAPDLGPRSPDEDLEAGFITAPIPRPWSSYSPPPPWISGSPPLPVPLLPPLWRSPSTSSSSSSSHSHSHPPVPFNDDSDRGRSVSRRSSRVSRRSSLHSNSSRRHRHTSTSHSPAPTQEREKVRGRRRLRSHRRHNSWRPSLKDGKGEHLPPGAPDNRTGVGVGPPHATEDLGPQEGYPDGRASRPDPRDAIPSDSSKEGDVMPHDVHSAPIAE